ncbi:hypothetical protein GIB67_009869 [Kingdonia uniflora]|uniref:CRAL/TRIO N-terminal domain-containing protein n=1 Tax=Kingdonia uniflora TaxID=39325 RepID=A0A7J7L7P5_9MAGN|nr:hypothetical protein GIB67_009869 [Kingdonia uniflora]
MNPLRDEVAAKSAQGNNETEQTKVRLMRANVEKQDSSAKDVDDLLIRRFLRSRKLDIEKASTHFLKYLEWRARFVPNGSISESEIPSELGQNKVFLSGWDKTRRPISVVLGLMVYSLDKICASMSRPNEKFVSILDLEGWGYKNCDIRGYIGCLAIMQLCIYLSVLVMRLLILSLLLRCFSTSSHIELKILGKSQRKICYQSSKSVLLIFLLGFVFPVMWYYATVLYFGNYYHKDPREMAGLVASAIVEKLNQVLMEKKESKSGMEILNLFQVNAYEVKKQELMAKNEKLRELLHSMQVTDMVAINNVLGSWGARLKLYNLLLKAVQCDRPIVCTSSFL